MGLFIRTTGIARATTKIGMANILYNMKPDLPEPQCSRLNYGRKGRSPRRKSRNNCRINTLFASKCTDCTSIRMLIEASRCVFQSASSGITIDITIGQATRFRDSCTRVANLQSPSANTIFDGCVFSDNTALGIKSTGSYRTFDCVKTNTSGAITSVITDV